MWYSKRARRFSAIGADGGAEGGADRAEAMGRAGLAAVAGGRLEEGALGDMEPGPPCLQSIEYMKHVKRSVLLWYSPREIYDLVTAIELYPQFLPWCDAAQVLERRDDGVTARLGLSYAGVRHAFTTRNEHVEARSVNVRLVDGPFSVLDGLWAFNPIGDPALDRPACKVELDLRYAFASRALELVVSPVFDRVANTLVDCFVSRAEQVYGAR